MRNLDITDSRDKLLVYRDSGLLGPSTFEGMRLLEDAGGERAGQTPNQ
jgi:hypothetical protein